MNLTITAEELYYLGVLLQAKYIDYAYIAAMDDIQYNYALFQKEAQAQLVSRGILMEDFSGNIEIEENAKSLLAPIFFGEKESSADICYLGDEKKVDIFKFHFLDDKITMVTGRDKKLIIKEVDVLYLADFVSNILPENYSVKTSEKTDKIDKDNVTRFIAIKNILLGRTSEVRLYIESEGVFYQESSDGNIYSVTQNDFLTDALGVIKGDNYGL